MLARLSFPRRSLAGAALILSLSLAPSLSFAQAAPPPGYGPLPGYGAPPGYGPGPGYGPPPAYGPAPGYGAPPGYGPAPGYGAPPGYGPAPGYGPPPGYYASQPGYPPPAPLTLKKPRSPGMVIGGIVLTGVGGIGFIAGLLLLAAAETRSNFDKCIPNVPCNPPDHSGLANGGVAAVIAGGVAVAVGIPLILYGRKKVPVKPEPPAARVAPTARFAPDVSLGPRHFALRWQF